MPYDAGERLASVERAARELEVRYGKLDGLALLRAAIEWEFPGRIALVSSFGAESAALLDMVSRVDPSVPVIFLETGKLFGETLDYRNALVARLGLTDVRDIHPDPVELATADPDGDLWSRNPDACCHVRKVVPLARALSGFDAWISGRKRFHGGDRTKLSYIEPDGAHIKINPLAGWTRDDIETYYDVRELPRHPLFEQGYPSIGCAPCTRAVAPGEDIRAGRWSGMEKTECGIHEDYWTKLEK